MFNVYCIGSGIVYSVNLYNKTHSCMPSPLAPDPIRVQSCVWCLFWTNRNSMAGTSIFLSISSSNQSYKSFISAFSKWKYVLLLKLWWTRQSYIYMLQIAGKNGWTKWA